MVALALVGDGGTSEGDFHEALNFAAVWQAPVVFLVQNNGFAISVPLAKQTAAPTLAAQGGRVRHPGRLVDGNDAAAVYRGAGQASTRAAAGGGPTLVEALTYRIEAHTNADDATRYRGDAEVGAWRAHDPVPCWRPSCRPRPARRRGGRAAGGRGRAIAADVRERMNADVARPGRAVRARLRRADAALARQRAALLAELSGTAEPRRDHVMSPAQAAGATRQLRPRGRAARGPAP